MLGKAILDPFGIESDVGRGEGLNLLDLITTFERDKQLLLREGKLNLAGNPAVSGYEIHHGVSRGTALEIPAVLMSNSQDGAISEDGSILGTYFHGLFERKEIGRCVTKMGRSGGAELLRLQSETRIVHRIIIRPVGTLP